MLNNALAKVGALFLLVFAVTCEAYEPIPSESALPIMRGAGLPRIRSAAVLNNNQQQLNLNAFVHSNAIDSGSQNEALIIDGETRGLELVYRTGLTEKLEFAVAASWLNHSAGGLDSLIEGWHDAFSLSDGDRDLFEEDQLLFRYQQGAKVTEVTQRQNGISDTQVSLAYRLNQTQPSDLFLSMRAGVNLPTGDPDKATGSDKVDANLGIAASGQFFANKTWSWAAYLGYLYISDDELFGISTKHHNWFTSADLVWHASERWSWQIQLSGHSALFETEIDELKDEAWQISFASEYQFKNPRRSLRVYFSEDISVNASPDFAFGMAFKFDL